jgi:hypothetical protein
VFGMGVVTVSYRFLDGSNVFRWAGMVGVLLLFARTRERSLGRCRPLRGFSADGTVVGGRCL